jgi:hypothetical protein
LHGGGAEGAIEVVRVQQIREGFAGAGIGGEGLEAGDGIGFDGYLAGVIGGGRRVGMVGIAGVEAAMPGPRRVRVEV